MTVEYRVKKIARYVVTRHEDNGTSGSVVTKGIYDNAEIAYEVGYALCKAEHDASGEPIGSMSFVYPQRLAEAADGPDRNRTHP